MIIKTKNLIELNKIVKKNNGKFIVVEGSTNEFNRKVLEIKNISCLLSPEKGHTYDKLKQRDSGLNQVLCKLAKENNISIGININEIQEEKDKKKKAERIARVLQNIKLCKKIKTRMLIFSKTEDKSGLRSFLLSLGMPSDMVKESIKKICDISSINVT